MDLERLWHSAAVDSHELAGQSARSEHADLLPQDSPNRDFETIPAAGSP
jgi:hypothetical protein